MFRSWNVLLSALPEFKLAVRGVATTRSRPEKEAKTETTVSVSIIGAPNSGKSTFINRLVDHRVCPTSNKVHTTRRASKAVHVRNNQQMILFDTPGLVTKSEVRKHHLESSFTSSARSSIQASSLIGVLHDASNHWTRNSLSPMVVETLEMYPKNPSILILNKIDQLRSKRVLLDTIKCLTLDTLAPTVPERNVPRRGISSDHSKSLGWGSFSKVFMISALTGDGLDEVLDYMYSFAQPGQWEFPADVITDQKPEAIVEDSVRARLLDYLPQEIPYRLTCQLEFYEEKRTSIYASVHVTCPNPRIERLVCGEQNGKLKQITERVTSDLVETFRKAISLTITTSAGKKD